MFRKRRKKKWSYITIVDSTFVDRIQTAIDELVLENKERDVLLYMKKTCIEFGGLNERDLNRLDSIEKKFSRLAVKKRKQWLLSYNKKKRKDVSICAIFHMKWKAGRFIYTKLARRVIYDPEFVPTEKQYNTLCKNRHSKAVLKEYYRKPKFKPADLIQFKSNTPYIYSINGWVGNNKGIVIEVVGEITKPLTGAKKYRVLPFGSTHPVRVEERYMKKVK